MYRAYLVCMLLGALLIYSCSSSESRPPQSPNIVIILADDMGYGDIQHYNPRSKIETPNLNRLCEEGAVLQMRIHLLLCARLRDMD